IARALPAKSAMLATAAIDVVPLNIPVPATRDRVIVAVASAPDVSVLPEASRIVTIGCVVNATLAGPADGCVVNAMVAAAPAFTVSVPEFVVVNAPLIACICAVP